MKKLIPLLILIPYLFIAGKQTPSRYSTSGDMIAAFLIAMQQNDTVHYLEMYPTREEAVIALRMNKGGSDSITAQFNESFNASYYYMNRLPKATQMFEGVRKKVIDEGVNWNDVQVVSTDVKKMKNNSYASDSLYEVIVNLSAGVHNITMRLQEVMLTKGGWNCGMNLRTRVFLAQNNDEQRIKFIMDSLRIADSLAKAKHNPR